MFTRNSELLYCNSLTNYTRRKSSVVEIGSVPVGGDYPIRLQSMTNTKTLDTKATVEQIIRLTEAGSEYVRIAVPGIKDAENLANISAKLKKQGYKTPLIADIHFNPKAAEIAAKYVEKVRINPGNYVNRKAFKTINYSDKEYQNEIKKIHDWLIPLLNICKEHDTAIRIGTNHGSLSDKIMSRYGDTPLGMVESAMEFLRICGEENFHNIVLSMKSSNTRVMIQAYRLLVSKMIEEGMNYPLHLGVTEAGDGEDGRIKSAIGIGTLMVDGLGDTIRVSLTEEPEYEIPVARKIVHYFSKRSEQKSFEEIPSMYYKPYEFNKRKSTIHKFHKPTEIPLVVLSKTGKKLPGNIPFKANYIYSNDKKLITESTNVDFICNYEIWKSLDSLNCFPLLSIDEFNKLDRSLEIKTFLKIHCTDLHNEVLDKMTHDEKLVLIFESSGNQFVSEARLFFYRLNIKGIDHPVILYMNYNDTDPELLQVKSSCDFGALLSDGFGDGIWIGNASIDDQSAILNASFGILQACRLRISKTEYIACPSCGRTLFNLQDALAKIRKKTSHLKGLKIGIMGCIVNGPGEMADADYGYVGSVAGKISLYKGQDLVKKNIPAENAVDELIALIKDHGDWKEKS